MRKDSKCKCTLAQSLVGDGCRYCQPQDYIDRLHDEIKQMLNDIEWYQIRVKELEEELEAIAQPAQEPVYIVGKGWNCDEMPAEGTKLYTHPAPSWQGLSTTEYMVLASNFTDDENMVVDEIGFARAIEQALKEKNHD